MDEQHNNRDAYEEALKELKIKIDNLTKEFEDRFTDDITRINIQIHSKTAHSRDAYVKDGIVIDVYHLNKEFFRKEGAILR